MWPFVSPYPISYSCSIVIMPLFPALFEILGPKDNWVTTLTFLGHVTRSVMWPFVSPYPISYSCSIVTMSLSPALFEILGPKDNWVRTLTFLGHVTSSVMWPLDSPHPISYSSSIVTKALSLTVFEILGSKVPVLCKSWLRMRNITWPVPLCKIWVRIWISHTHIASSLWHGYWAPMKNKGCLLVRPPMLNAKSSPKICQILVF